MRRNHPVDQSLLMGLTPLGQLGPDALRELCSKATIEDGQKGTTLFRRRDTDDWTYYLIDGTVRLETGNGGSETVIGGSIAAQLPLSPQRPRRSTAVAESAIRYLRIPANLLDVLMHAGDAIDLAEDEIHADDAAVENRLLYEIYQDYINDELQLPTLPSVALRIRTAVNDPDSDIDTIQQIVFADQVIAAQLIKVANSAANRGVTPVSTCHDAIARIGMTATQDIVTAITLRSLFKKLSGLLGERMQALWEHSVTVAILSFILARETGGMDADRTMLAGLVHDIGILSVIARARYHPELSAGTGANTRQLDQAIDKLGAQFGAMILRKWDFPGDFITTTLESEDWLRDPAPTADCCDVILLAQRHLAATQTGDPRQLPPIDTLPAFDKLAPGATDGNNRLQVLLDAGDEIDTLRQALMGG